MRTQVVVLGGGYGGVAFARNLVQRSKRTILPVSVTLIDRNCSHTLLTELHEVAAGSLAPQMVQLPLARLEGVRFLQAEVTGLNPHTRQVLTSAGPVPYDLLVLALGGVDHDFGVPGVRNHALMLHSLPEALTIRDRLASLPAGTPVLIAGGGLTGVELAAELGLHRGGDCNLTLVEASSTLLPGPGLGRRARRAARRRLGALGVNVLLGAKVTRVEEGLAHLADGTVLPFGLLVWACGVKGNPLMAALGIPTDQAGRVQVDANLQTALPGVYALGDCAAGGLPPTAQAASRQGAALAEHLCGALTSNVRPVRLLGTLVSLGRLYATASFGRLELTGWIPALLKRAAALRWLWLAAGPARALRHALGLSPDLPAAGKVITLPQGREG